VGDEPTFAPDFILVEVAHVLRREERRGKIRPERAGEAIEDLRTVSLQTVKVVGLLGRLWELRHNLSAYDATYVALAEQLDASLVTGDGRIAGAPGIAAEIAVI
jgi:predicted nucleic acid-binding protein